MPLDPTPTPTSFREAATDRYRTAGHEPAPDSPGYPTGSEEEPRSSGNQTTSDDGSPTSRGYQSDSPEGDQVTPAGHSHQSGSAEPAPASDGYRFGSEEHAAAGDGYRCGSEEPAPGESDRNHVPRADSAPADPEEDSDRIDPLQAYAEAAAARAEEKRREQARQEPAIWLPGRDDLDEGPQPRLDSQTRFSRDDWGGRGNPQVSVRLRPRDFERLGRAADLYGVRRTTLARMMVIRGVGAILDAELRKSADLLRERSAR